LPIAKNALLQTTASVYQMIRGAMVLFTAMFSVIFLKRRLYVQHFAGLALVVMGIAIVGLSSVLYNAKGMRLRTGEKAAPGPCVSPSMYGRVLEGGTWFVPSAPNGKPL
jgi:hypothetical protein